MTPSPVVLEHLELAAPWRMLGIVEHVFEHAELPGLGQQPARKFRREIRELREALADVDAVYSGERLKTATVRRLLTYLAEHGLPSREALPPEVLAAIAESTGQVAA
ncbi:hypothetical protein FSW04_17630 [Baekduia soli]|uniref:Uncharacterized protein n=1 Tax=Baekduia soli TaxID=496014 RepID=A0A5B8U7Y3_9ACTN|nr:hypothetical protein [Baekduia soli]QEC49219.1 hypothetical protein FSW04_17630 [Baekduia soli]